MHTQPRQLALTLAIDRIFIQKLSPYINCYDPFQALCGTYLRVLSGSVNEKGSITLAVDFLQEQLVAQTLMKQQLEEAKQLYKIPIDRKASFSCYIATNALSTTHCEFY